MAPDKSSRKRKASAVDTAAKKIKTTKLSAAKSDHHRENTPLDKNLDYQDNKRQIPSKLQENEQSAQDSVIAVVEDQVNSEFEEDDQTEALLKGFESSDEDHSGDEGFQKDQDVLSLPTDAKLHKRLKGVVGSENDGPGIIYVGRIPHGFYEHEMRAYFSQFGDIRRLRLSRNRKTGRSKHYAFIEFKSREVAQIVADTMDSYLMFGHILKCKIVPREQVHERLWKGANKRFKKVPWAKIEGRALQAGKTRDQWNKKIKAETHNRKNRQEKLKAMGYEYEPPALKAIEDVPKRIEVEALDDLQAKPIEGGVDDIRELEAAENDVPIVEALEEDKKAKNAGKAKTSRVHGELEKARSKSAKKAKKSISNPTA